MLQSLELQFESLYLFNISAGVADMSAILTQIQTINMTCWLSWNNLEFGYKTGADGHAIYSFQIVETNSFDWYGKTFVSTYLTLFLPATVNAMLIPSGLKASKFWFTVHHILSESDIAVIIACTVILKIIFLLLLLYLMKCQCPDEEAAKDVFQACDSLIFLDLGLFLQVGRNSNRVMDLLF